MNTGRRWRRRNQRRRGLEKPIWAPNSVDTDVMNITPLPGWIIIEEQFEQDQRAIVAGVEIAIAQPGTTNTTIGKVVNVNNEDAKSIGISAGEKIVYREWEGGRWDFAGRKVLLIGSEHIIAKLED